jgi:hypothetical protein
MQWSKVLTVGAVGGIVNFIFNFLMHGVIMENTYRKYTPDVFREGANMMWFVILPVLTGLVGAVLFAKTRASWQAGPKGGVIFGLWVGLLGLLGNFYSPLTITGYPYFLAWCTGAIIVIGWMVYGAVVGAMYKA